MIHAAARVQKSSSKRDNKKNDNRGYCLSPVISNMHKQLNDGNPLVMTTFCENQREGVSCPSTPKKDLSAMVRFNVLVSLKTKTLTTCFSGVHTTQQSPEQDRPT